MHDNETVSNPTLLVNRELSMLEFQRRVLEEALDERNPLLERLKFLAIVGSNMDEFFMVRVSGILKQVEARFMGSSPDGMTPPDELAAIRKSALGLYADAHQCFIKKLKPKLDKAGIHLMDYAKLSKTQKDKVDDYFKEVVFPILTPLALDPGHPFPHISNLSLNLAIVIRDKKGNEKFARLKVPDTLPRLVPIKRSSGNVRKDGTIPFHHYFVWLDQLIMANLKPSSPAWRSFQRISSALFATPISKSRSLKRTTCLRPCSRASAGESLVRSCRWPSTDTMPPNLGICSLKIWKSITMICMCCRARWTCPAFGSCTTMWSVTISNTRITPRISRRYSGMSNSPGISSRSSGSKIPASSSLRFLQPGG